MSVRRQAMDRTQRRLRISEPIALDKRRAMLSYDMLQEIDQQFQLPISGTARAIIVWASITVTFDVDFFDAPEQSDSSLSRPTFTYGAFLDPTTGATGNETGAIVVTAVVNEYIVDTRGAITGAAVAIGVFTAGALDTDFTGSVHLVFQGYGAITESADALDVGT